METHSEGQAAKPVVPFEARLFTVQQLREVLPIGHTKVYELINQKRLDARKIDGRTVITGRSIQELINGLPPFSGVAA